MMRLTEWIDRHAGLTPGKTAIRCGNRDISYAALAQQIERLASALAASGVKRGDCAAWLGYNSPEMLALLFACARLGALFMPLNWRLAAPEHKQMLEDCPPAVLCVEPDFLAQTESILPATGGPRRVALGSPRAGWESWEAFCASDTAAVPPAEADPQTPLLICYTSGSTGKPKGVLLTQDALAWNAVNSADMHDLTAEDRVLTTLPLFHVGGLNNQTMPALAAGCTVVLHPRFDVEATFDAIARERISLTVLVPAQLDMMMAHPRWQSADFSSLRSITTGSTIVQERLIRAVHARGVPLIQVYGSTDTGPRAFYLRGAAAAPTRASTGKAGLHCGMRIVDDLDRDVAAGATGEILIRGPNVMSGYWRNPQASAEALRGGWFHSGDMGHLDAEGYLTVDGRKKEMIISGGENIYPAEIENVLLDCPDIAEASVVGRPDPRWGEIVVAVVAPKPGRRLDAEQVLHLFEGRIARYKHPKEVVFVGQLPKTALGKIRKEDVRQMVARETTA
jgi:fatty-acyl-CoA synthase